MMSLNNMKKRNAMGRLDYCPRTDPIKPSLVFLCSLVHYLVSKELN